MYKSTIGPTLSKRVKKVPAEEYVRSGLLFVPCYTTAHNIWKIKVPKCAGVPELEAGLTVNQLSMTQQVRILHCAPFGITLKVATSTRIQVT